MDLSINFPLILVLLTGGCGLVWLFEVYWLAPRRPKAEGNPDQSNLAQPAVVEYAISFFSRTVVCFGLAFFPRGAISDSFRVHDSNT